MPTDIKVSKLSYKSNKTEEASNLNNPITNNVQNGNGHSRKSKNRKSRNKKKNRCSFPVEALKKEENKVNHSPNDYENRSKNDNDLIENFQIKNIQNDNNNDKDKEISINDTNFTLDNEKNDTINKTVNESKFQEEDQVKSKLIQEKQNSNKIEIINDNKNNINNESDAKLTKKTSTSLNKINKQEETNLRDNLIIINDQASSENTSPQIHKIEPSLSNKSLEKRNSQSPSPSISSRNDKNNLNDSTGGLKADQSKENLDEIKSNFAKNRQREDSILTEIQENLNENYSSLAKFFVKESNKDINCFINAKNAESSSNTENSKADNAISNKDEFAGSNGAGEIDTIATRKLQLKLFLDKALEHKLLANDYFKKNKFNEAIREYTKVIYNFLF